MSGLIHGFELGALPIKLRDGYGAAAGARSQ